MKLELHVTQTQTLAPQVIQSLEVLQMNAQELGDYLQRLGQENPVVELVYDQPVLRETPRGAGQWLAASDRQNRWYHREDARVPEDYAEASEGETLAEHILQQLSTDHDPVLDRAVRLLAERLDANGWLPEGPEELAEGAGLPLDKVEQALALIQGAEPAGVGARDLRECLLLQLTRQPEADGLTVRIVSDFLPELAKNHYHQIARALRVSQDRVRRCLKEIQRLDPRPGAPYAPAERTVYVAPDVLVVPVGNGLELVVNDGGLPRMNISDYYLRVLQDSDDPEVKRYLEEKVQQARWVESAISQRRDTVLRCVRAMVHLQRDYFYRGGAIRPMTLADVASLAEVHESTVSRAIRGKWLQSPEGIVPMSKFFSRRLPGGQDGEHSPDEVKGLLKRLVMEEDPTHPLTDQRLCDLLANAGYMVARRTVAKYRSEMGFPSATGRKR